MEEQWYYDAVVTDPQASCDAAAVQVILNWRENIDVLQF